MKLKKALRILMAGVIVSFLGALPLGTQNPAALQVAISEGWQPAVVFAGGLVVADALYIYVTLLAMQWIQQRKRLFKVLEWLTLLIVLALAAANFYAAASPVVQANVVLTNRLPRFFLGFVLNGLNPMQVPFWLGWTTVLFTKKILQPRWNHYHLFVIGATIGMSAATLLFIFGGRLIAERISSQQRLVYVVIGFVFLITAAIQIWKMVRKKDAVHKLEHPEELTVGLEDNLTLD